MVTLKKLIISCRNTELNGAANRMVAKFDEGDWSGDAHLTGLFASLKEENAKLTSAINRTKAHSELEEKDDVRDNKVKSIHYLLQGYLHFPDDVIKPAAKIVDKIFEKYGLELISESYVTESSLIVSMLEDFSATEAQTEIAKMPGLSNLITELTTAQNAFENARIAYESEQAEEETFENATGIKKDVGIIINDKIRVYLMAMTQVDETTYAAFARAVGKIITDTNEQVKKRREDDTPPEEPKNE